LNLWVRVLFRCGIKLINLDSRLRGNEKKARDSMDFSGDLDMGGVLLIGEQGEVFAGGDIRGLPACRVEQNVLDGIRAAAQGAFSIVAVVMSAAAGRLSSALRALRSSSDARILLLARMYEEPQAMELTRGRHNGSAVADDYVVYPLSVDKFYELIVPGPSGQKDNPQAGGIVDEAMQARIRRLERLATEDDLTGLKNRRYIWEFARQIIERSKSRGGRVTLLVFDIDDFKHYNDQYGHTAGDELLRQAGTLMRRCCRRQDVVGRIGGDEFAVIFWDDPNLRASAGAGERRSPAAKHPREVIFIAKRFKAELLNAEFGLLGPAGQGTLTISGGLASLGRDGRTMEELFAQADAALLDAKRGGKNRIYLVGGPQNNIDKIE